MFILRSFGKSIGGLSPAPAALPMNLSDEVFPHSMLSKLLPRLIFKHLRRSLILQRDPWAQKKRRAPVLSDVRRLWVVYIQSPRANISIWIFASEGLYSLCHNNTYRNHNLVIYRVMPIMDFSKTGCKNTTFPTYHKIFPHFSCKSQPLFVALRLYWGNRCYYYPHQFKRKPPPSGSGFPYIESGWINTKFPSSLSLLKISSLTTTSSVSQTKDTWLSSFCGTKFSPIESGPLWKSACARGQKI